MHFLVTAIDFIGLFTFTFNLLGPDFNLKSWGRGILLKTTGSESERPRFEP